MPLKLAQNAKIFQILWITSQARSPRLSVTCGIVERRRWIAILRASVFRPERSFRSADRKPDYGKQERVLDDLPLDKLPSMPSQ
jgi:hypothetical protein